MPSPEELKRARLRYLRTKAAHRARLGVLRGKVRRSLSDNTPSKRELRRAHPGGPGPMKDYDQSLSMIEDAFDPLRAIHNPWIQIR